MGTDLELSSTHCEPFVSRRRSEPLGLVLQPSLVVAWRHHTRQCLINRFLCLIYVLEIQKSGVVKKIVGDICMCLLFCERFYLEKLLASPSFLRSGQQSFILAPEPMINILINQNSFNFFTLTTSNLILRRYIKRCKTSFNTLVIT